MMIPAQRMYGDEMFKSTILTVEKSFIPTTERQPVPVLQLSGAGCLHV
jgi:hypothetical protein